MRAWYAADGGMRRAGVFPTLASVAFIFVRAFTALPFWAGAPSVLVRAVPSGYTWSMLQPMAARKRACVLEPAKPVQRIDVTARTDSRSRAVTASDTPPHAARTA
jgi:hypothetical protein